MEQLTLGAINLHAKAIPIFSLSWMEPNVSCNQWHWQPLLIYAPTRPKKYLKMKEIEITCGKNNHHYEVSICSKLAVLLICSLDLNSLQTVY